MKRHLPRVLSSFRSSKRRIPVIQTETETSTKTLLITTYSKEKAAKNSRSRSAETICRKLKVPLAEDEVFSAEDMPIICSFVRRRDATVPTSHNNSHFWDFNKRFSTNYASFRAKKSAQISSTENCRVFKLVINNYEKN